MIGLLEADLGPGVYESAILFGLIETIENPDRGLLFNARREPSALELKSERKQGFYADTFYGRARCSPMLGGIKT